jgi:hypothetical protein
MSSLAFFISQNHEESFRLKDATMFFNDRLETIEIVQRLRIPTTMLASAAGISAPRLSDFMRHRNLSSGTAEKIKDTAQKIALVWETFSPYRIILDEPELLESAVRDARITLMNRETQELTAELMSVIVGNHA